MNDEKDKGLSESTSNDLKSIASNTQNAIKMAKQTANTAKTITKAAANAAAGNMVGAAAELAKDPETIKTIIIIVLVISMVLGFVTVAFLYALPTAIFEAMSNFVDYVKEKYETIKLSNTNGTNGFINVVECVTQIVSEGARNLLSDAWNGIKTFFKGLFNSKNQTENMSTDGYELTVIAQEAAEKLAVIQKMVAANDKYLIRAKEIQDAITGKNDDITDFISEHFSGDDYVMSGVTVSNSLLHMGADGDEAKNAIAQLTNIVKDMEHVTTMAEMEVKMEQFDNIVQTVFAEEQNYDGINILSLLLTQQGGSLTDMKMSDFMRFLGYYDDDCEYNTKFALANTDDDSLLLAVQDWKGTFKPQYLMEEMQNLRDERVKLELKCSTDEEIESNPEIQAINDKLEEYEQDGIALIDWMVELRFPKLNFDSSKMEETAGTGENEVFKTYFGNTAAEKVIVHEWSNTEWVPAPTPPDPPDDPDEGTDPDDTEPTPSEPAGELVTTYYRTVNINYRIQPRDINTIIEYIGLKNTGSVS